MDYNVLDFDADKSGKVISTRAVQKAIDACSADGGGRIIIPSAAKNINRHYLS
jgi:polygalacturonase